MRVRETRKQREGRVEGEGGGVVKREREQERVRKTRMCSHVFTNTWTYEREHQSE